MKIYKESLDAMLSIVRQYTQQTTDMEIERRVYDIIENVRTNGDAALREYSEQFDGVKLDDFKVDQSIIGYGMGQFTRRLETRFIGSEEKYN